MTLSTSAPLQVPAPVGQSGANAFAAHAPDGLAGGDLRLAQLLCSRLCHDLIGAAGAISNGVELLADGAADAADIHDLLELSGRQLNRRLAFYRHAFAMNGNQSGLSSVAEARRLATAFLDDTRVGLRWHEDWASPDAGVDGVPAGLVRVLLCAILIAAEGLPRGGVLAIRISCDVGAIVLSIDGEGRDAALPPPVHAALAPQATLEASMETVTARTVPAYYLGRLARQLDTRVEVVARDDGFTLNIVPVRP